VCDGVDTSGIVGVDVDVVRSLLWSVRARSATRLARRFPRAE